MYGNCVATVLRCLQLSTCQLFISQDFGALPLNFRKCSDDFYTLPNISEHVPMIPDGRRISHVIRSRVGVQFLIVGSILGGTILSRNWIQLFLLMDNEHTHILLMPSSSTEFREQLSCMRVIDVIDPQACDPHIIVSELVGIVLSRTNIITLQSSTDDLIQLFHSNTQVKFPVLGDTFWDFWKAVLKKLPPGSFSSRISRARPC